MWFYYQKSGDLYHDDDAFAKGYSGKYSGKNNPEMEAVKMTGPLPCGIYRIGDSYLHPMKGPITMDLEPDPSNDMFGRDLFRIHGDSIANPGFASEGCIVLPHEARVEVAKLVAAGDRLLEVVKEKT